MLRPIFFSLTALICQTIPAPLLQEQRKSLTYQIFDADGVIKPDWLALIEKYPAYITTVFFSHQTANPALATAQQHRLQCGTASLCSQARL